MSTTIDWPSYKRGECTEARVEGRWDGSFEEGVSGQEWVLSPSVRSRGRVTCYSMSPTGILDYRYQHHRSDELRSFFKRFSTSLGPLALLTLLHATTLPWVPLSRSQTRPSRMGTGRESRVVDLTVAIYVNEREFDDMELRSYHLIRDCFHIGVILK